MMLLIDKHRFSENDADDVIQKYTKYMTKLLLNSEAAFSPSGLDKGLTHFSMTQYWPAATLY